MSFLSRIVLYLRPEVPADNSDPKKPVPLAPALFAFKHYPSSNTATTETDITTTNDGQILMAGRSIDFNVTSLDGSRCFLYGPPVKWPGGCRAYVSCILGEAGDNESDNTGVKYTTADTTGIQPVTELYCSFNGDGILTCRDDRGVTITMDLKQPGRGALCLTLVPAGHEASGKVWFPKKEFAEKVCVH